MKFRIRKHVLVPINHPVFGVHLPAWRVTLTLPDDDTGDSILVARRFPTHTEALAYALGHVLPNVEEPTC